MLHALADGGIKTVNYVSWGYSKLEVFWQQITLGRDVNYHSSFYILFRQEIPNLLFISCIVYINKRIGHEIAYCLWSSLGYSDCTITLLS